MLRDSIVTTTVTQLEHFCDLLWHETIWIISTKDERLRWSTTIPSAIWQQKSDQVSKSSTSTAKKLNITVCCNFLSICAIFTTLPCVYVLTLLNMRLVCSLLPTAVPQIPSSALLSTWDRCVDTWSCSLMPLCKIGTSSRCFHLSLYTFKNRLKTLKLSYVAVDLESWMTSHQTLSSSLYPFICHRCSLSLYLAADISCLGAVCLALPTCPAFCLLLVVLFLLHLAAHPEPGSA